MAHNQEWCINLESNRQTVAPVNEGLPGQDDGASTPRACKPPMARTAYLLISQPNFVVFFPAGFVQAAEVFVEVLR